MAGAGVVDRDFEALPAVVQQRALEQVEIVDGLLLGDLENDALLREPVLADDVARQRFVTLFEDARTYIEEEVAAGWNAGSIFNRFETADAFQLCGDPALRGSRKKRIGAL